MIASKSEKEIKTKNNNTNIKEKLKKLNLLKLKNSKKTLPDLNIKQKNKDALPNIKHQTRNISINIFNNMNTDTKNNLSKINTNTPKTLSPMNSNYKKFNFLFRKKKLLENLTLKNNNISKFFKKDKKDNTSYNNSITATKLKKNFSSYFYKSQSSLYSSKRIYRHYIQESDNDIIIPEKYFYKCGKPKPKKEIEQLDKLNINYHKRLEEIKHNKSIALKKDFNILSYQGTLLRLISKKMSEKNFKELQRRYIKFNEKNFGIGVAPRGRFTNLAEKIKYNVPLFLYEKIRKLDKDKLISRYNYFKRENENFKNRFEKMYNKTHKKFFKENKDKNSSIIDINKNKTKYVNFNYSF